MTSQTSGWADQLGNATATGTADLDYLTMAWSVARTIPYKPTAAHAPRMKKRRNTGLSVRRCMNHDATSTNFTRPITSRSVTISPSGMSPSRYEVAISMAVMTDSTTATITYWIGSG